MADLADELLDDLAPTEPVASEASTNGEWKGKRKASDADLDDLDLLSGGGTATGTGNDHDDAYDDAQDDDQSEDDHTEDDNGGELQLGSNSIKAVAELDQATIDAMDLGPSSGGGKQIALESLLTLPGSSRLSHALKQVQPMPEQSADMDGVLEETPEYQLLVHSNNLIVELDNEMRLAHKLIRDQYRPRFPQLETLIPDPWELIRAVAALGNRTRLGDAKLEGVLPSGTITVISIEASKTTGTPLPSSAWELVQKAIDAVSELESAKRALLAYVEFRITLIAPNLSALVGARVATQLLGVAGGLNTLSKMPSCNVLLLGSQKKSATSAAVAGLSTAHSGKHRGFIASTDLVLQTPEEYRTQAQRMLSAKAVLAARVDSASSRGSNQGTYGSKLYAEVSKKLDKLIEPPPSKMTKALPVPKEEGRRQRRGGRQARKRKERYGMTETRKMANKVQFGVAEEEADAFGDAVGMGMIQSAQTGRVRALQAESRSRAKLSKRHAQRIEQFRHGGTAQNPAAVLDAPVHSSLDSIAENSESTVEPPSSVSARMRANQDAIAAGTASSLTFTPAQGIELVNPMVLRQKKVDEANQKWFRQGTFSLLPGAQSTTGSSANPNPQHRP